MAFDEAERTPTEQGQPVSGVATLKEIAIALRLVSDGFLAGAEVHRGRSEPERDLFLRLSAERLQNLRHLILESEQLLLSLTGHRSGEITVAPKEKQLTPSKLDVSSISFAGLATTVLASKPFGERWSIVAAGGLYVAAWLVARFTPHTPASK